MFSNLFVSRVYGKSDFLYLSDQLDTLLCIKQISVVKATIIAPTKDTVIMFKVSNSSCRSIVLGPLLLPALDEFVPVEPVDPVDPVEPVELPPLAPPVEEGSVSKGKGGSTTPVAVLDQISPVEEEEEDEREGAVPVEEEEEEGDEDRDAVPVEEEDKDTAPVEEEDAAPVEEDEEEEEETTACPVTVTLYDVVAAGSKSTF